MSEAPKFLVEWASPWQEFLTAVRPALARSPRPLAGEARTGLMPYRGIAISWFLEAALLTVAAVVPGKLDRMQPQAERPSTKYDVIYYSGDELPQIEDISGAKAGRSGRAGGREAHHRSQSVRVSRDVSLRERLVDAPNLTLPVSNSAVANLLAYKPVPGPPPADGMRTMRATLVAPATTPVAPAPEFKSPRPRTTVPLQGDAVAPPPQVTQHDLPQAHLPRMNTVQAVPPPAAPPEQLAKTDRPALPSPNVIAPVPKVVQRDLPPVRLPGMNAVQVVPPPVSAPEQLTKASSRLVLPTPTAVAPAPTQITREMSPRGPGLGPGEFRKQVVVPPVQITGPSSQHQSVPSLGSRNVVPPPVQIAGPALPNGSRPILGNGAVVAPAPAVSGDQALAAAGTSKRTGLGVPMDVARAPLPTANAGGGGGKGIIVSSQPGPDVGKPGNGAAGSLALSPAGGAIAGVGGSGSGAGIGRGNGPGSGFSGDGTGAGRDSAGRGADVNARGGTSPYPGTGGTGASSNRSSVVPGVSVRGGTTIVNLPSFASGSNNPTQPGRSSVGKDQGGPAITVVATSRSGGAFNFYGVLKGDRVYTIYIDTTMGPTVMQYADPASAAHPYAEELIAPQPLRAELPSGLPRARMVIACTLDRSGLVRHPQVLETMSAVVTSKVLAALNSWKFKPVMRGNEAVEVNAILGFNIDTKDRF